MKIFCRMALPLILLSFLSGCAAKVRTVTLPPPVKQSSPLTGNFERGTVLAVRPAAPVNTTLTNAVLAALGQPQTSAIPGGAVELIIRRQDGSTASVIQQGQFFPGEQIAIVEAAATVIRPQ